MPFLIRLLLRLLFRVRVLGDLAPLFKLPDWMSNLSIFHLYGNPIAGTTSWTAAVWMVVVFAAGFGAALVLMRRRDVSSA